MAEDFSKNKSHEENIKVSIDKILGSNTVLKRSKRTAEDHRRAVFVNLINQMIYLDLRDTELDVNFMLDLSKYNAPFYSVIDAMLALHFNKAQIDLIHFYLYDRITPEGFMIELIDQDGKAMDLSSHEKLYEYIKLMK